MPKGYPQKTLKRLRKVFLNITAEILSAAIFLICEPAYGQGTSEQSILPQNQQEEGRLETNIRGLCDLGSQGNAQALKDCEDLSRQGNITARFYIAFMHLYGVQLEKNPTLAAILMRSVAEAGVPEAEYYLGLFYQTGNGVFKSLSEAAAWFRRAADHGHAQAQLALSGMLLTGNGITRNTTAAVSLLKQAAQQGEPQAQRLLATYLELGQFVKKDVEEAFLWYRQAAMQGDAIAEAKMGFALSIGQGTIQNVVEALGWYTLALASSLKEKDPSLASQTEQALQNLLASMSQEEIAQGQQYAIELYHEIFRAIPTETLKMNQAAEDTKSGSISPITASPGTNGANAPSGIETAAPPAPLVNPFKGSSFAP